jgi:antirestriction protein ArdC
LYVPLTVLNSDPRAIFTAASKAQANADLMHAQQRCTNVARRKTGFRGICQETSPNPAPG